MVKFIAPAKKLAIFFRLWLTVKLTKPQRSHTERFVEGVLAIDGERTLVRILQQGMDPRHPSSLADFFTCSPWDDVLVGDGIIKRSVKWVLEAMGTGGRVTPPIIISIDDSHTPKPSSSKHFEPVAWYCDEKGYKYALCFVSMHIRCGNRSMPLGFEIYLKHKTVQELNRKRKKEEQKLVFKTKLDLCIQMLQRLQPLLPQGVLTYVLFDSWYASERLIRFCLAQGWHAICGLKSNRSFNGKKVSRHARWLRKKSLRRVRVGSAGNSRVYWTFLKKGRIKGISKEVGVIFSKRTVRDRRYAFFLCTDTSLTAGEALRIYAKRWEIEVDYLYLKDRLGLGDFRLRSMEAIRKYFSLQFLTLSYLYWRKTEENKKTIAEVIGDHRQDQMKQVLRAFGEKVLETKSVDTALEQFLPEAA